jgi:hypothetical protein
VDVEGKKAFFRHLHRFMPEVKPDQQTFTVRFDPKVHAVSTETKYFRQWRDLIEDYNKRLADCPRLREIVSQLDLSHISKEDRVYFHEFIDCANRLLDLDFPVVKEQFFNGVWKLGVRVSSADPAQVGFELYAIGLDDPAILVSGVPPSKPSDPPAAPPEALPVSSTPKTISFSLQGAWPNESAIQFNWRARSFLKSPKQEAERFVFDYLRKMLRAKSLPLYGKRLSTEYLFWFVDRFGRSLGIQPSDRLKLAELNYAVHIYLPAWASIAVPRFLGDFIRLNKHNPDVIAHAILSPPFEHVACVYPETLSPTKAEVIRLIESGRDLAPTRVSFSEVSPQSLAQAVDFLMSQSEEWIERPYKPRCHAPKWIWSGYSANALRHNIPSILIGSVDEYRLFVERNQIPLRKSRFLSQCEAIIYVANFAEWEAAEGLQNSPVLNTYTVKNEDCTLPKVTVIDLSQASGQIVIEKHRLKLHGVEREVTNSCPEHPTDLCWHLPMLNRVYTMLEEDLQRQYQSNFF